MKKKLPVNKLGFTIIELVIVISLIAIFSGTVIPRLTSFSHSQNLEQSALNFENTLYEARSLAMSSVASDSGSKVEWGISILTDTSYALGQRDENTSDSLAVKKTYKLPENVTISPSGANVQVVFKRLSGHCIEGAQDYTFTEMGGSSVSVVIYDNGRIQHQ